MDPIHWDLPRGTSGTSWALRRLLLRPPLTALLKMLGLLLVDPRWSGEEHIPSKGACILAANHVSFLDPPLLSYAVHEATRRMPHWMAWDALWSRWMGPLLPLYGAVPVRRSRPRPSDLKAALQVLGEGRVLGVFPEGGTSEDGRLRRFLPGILSLLLRHPCPVLPATVLGTRDAWPREYAFARPSVVRVVFHPPLRPDPRQIRERRGAEQFLDRLSRAIGRDLPGGVADLPADEAPPRPSDLGLPPGRRS